MSGYTSCACGTCFDVVSDDMSKPDLCLPCEEAGCEHDGECQRDPEIDEEEE